MLLRQLTSLSTEEPLGKELLAAVEAPDKWNIPFPLPHMKPATERDFWSWRSSYSFKSEAYLGQHKVDVGNGETKWAIVTMFYVGHSHHIDGGFAVAYVHEYRNEKILYFTWRKCDHTFKEKNIGRCLNEYTCERCGKGYTVDSSD